MMKQVFNRIRYWLRDQKDISHQEMLERMRELGIGVKNDSSKKPISP